MDAKLRQAQRDFHKDKDLEAAERYIRLLEQQHTTTEHKKVQNTDPTFPCLLCEKDIHPEGGEVTIDGSQHEWILHPNHRALPHRAVAVHTYGNYGSQVLDDTFPLYFYICDSCVVRNSHKMLQMDDGKVKNAREVFDTWFTELHQTNGDGELDSFLESVKGYFDV